MNIKEMRKNILIKIKKYFKKLLVFKKSPHAVALGFSLGSFIALFPTVGFAYFIGLGVILVVPRINKVALFLGIAFWNPFILVPIYRLGYKLGNFLIVDLPIYTFFNSGIIKLSFGFALGSIIISAIISIVVYLTVFVIFKILNNEK